MPRKKNKKWYLMLYLSIGMFFVLQVGAGLLYKIGAEYPKLWITGFVAGNILGISSIYFLIIIYQALNPNVAEAICRGGFFILIQFAFIIFFGSRLNLIQWLGIFMIFSGIILISSFNTVHG